MKHNITRFLAVIIFAVISFQANSQSYFGIDGGGTQTLSADSLTDSGL